METSSFHKSSLLNGLELWENFINENEEKFFIHSIDSTDWSGNGVGSNPQLKRRLQQFGALFLTDKRILLPSEAEIPDFILPIKERLECEIRQRSLSDNEMNIDKKNSTPPAGAYINDLETPFNYVVFNEYLPGQGIAPHTDSLLYGPVICSLSLASSCLMSFYALSDLENGIEEHSLQIELPRRSMLIMSGDARHKYKHLISKDLIELSKDGKQIEN